MLHALPLSTYGCMAQHSWDELQISEGNNTITAPKNGILYLANENSAGSVTILSM
ncbi:hypothetical protein ACT691_11235 [Vibrio metschnikovii]